MEANKGPLKCTVCCYCHAKKESTSNIGDGGSCPPLSSSSSSSTTSSLDVSSTSKPQQQRHSVIIYMHSPKVIHTHSKDFIALAFYNKDDHQNHNNHVPHQTKVESGVASVEEDNKMINNVESQCNFQIKSLGCRSQIFHWSESRKS
ncbi:VQ motif-containing protein 20 [Gossypium australe]|uniref:VQ motif-containing protein 20 n=1 Tax=Gossypium australe TaxID=47621 RepID=A0A5B6VQ22_9ROSI|nr:VQ motif-containing protein 20 [Gossypium australe]